MVIPIYDNDPLEKSHRAYVTFALIAINIAIFSFQDATSDKISTQILLNFALFPVAVSGEAVTGGFFPPSLTVVNNRTATLQIGDQVPVVTQSAVGVIAAGSPVVNSVNYRDTGVILSITPHINESGRVLLSIEQEVSSVATTTTAGRCSRNALYRCRRTGTT